MDSVMPVDDIRATDDTRATSVNVIFVSFDWLIKSGPLQHLNSWEEGGRGVGGGGGEVEEREREGGEEGGRRRGRWKRGGQG